VTNVICQACGFLHRQEPWGAEEAAEFYRKASREYDRIYGYDRLHGEYVQKVQAAQARRRVRWLAEWAPAGARVLDVGCGNGAFVAAAREAGYAAEGMELDEAAIPVAPPVAAACELLGLDPLYVANEGRLAAMVPAESADVFLRILRAHPAAGEAAIIGRVTHTHPGLVELRNRFGGSRIVDLLSGEQMPRIC